TYLLSTLVEKLIQPDHLTAEQVANISGYIRENQGLSILKKDFEEFQMLRTPTVAEKAMKGLLAIATQYPEPGTQIYIPFHELEERILRLNTAALDKYDLTEACNELSLGDLLLFQSSCWARSANELQYIIDHFLKDQGLAEGEGQGIIMLTPRGWSAAEEARRGTIPSDRAFVAMSFREELASLYDDGLARGIRRAGYEPLR